MNLDDKIKYKMGNRLKRHRKVEVFMNLNDMREAARCASLLAKERGWKWADIGSGKYICPNFDDIMKEYKKFANETIEAIKNGADEYQIGSGRLMVSGFIDEYNKNKDYIELSYSIEP